MVEEGDVKIYTKRIIFETWIVVKIYRSSKTKIPIVWVGFCYQLIQIIYTMKKVYKAFFIYSFNKYSAKVEIKLSKIFKF